jgi:hydrogenase maturation protease
MRFLDGYDLAILVDAVPRGGEPGTVYLIEPEVAAPGAAQEEMSAAPMFDGHTMDPVKVLRAVAALGGKLDRPLLVGCELSCAYAQRHCAGNCINFGSRGTSQSADKSCQ